MYALSAIGLLIVYFILRNRSSRFLPWFVPPAILLLASCAFSLSDLGQGAGHWLNIAFGWPATWFGAAPIISVAITLVVLLVALFADLLFDQKADKWAKTALVLVPLIAMAASGPIAQGIQSVVHPIGNGVQEGTQKLSGQSSR